MKTASFKDTRREITHSFSRFMSIFLIVFIGCGFFSGINSTMPDMKITAEKYFEETNLSDLRLVSTIGIKSEDIKAVKSLDCVEGVCQGYSKDVFYQYKGQNLVLKFRSYNDKTFSSKDNMNKLTLIEGRMPEKPGEIVVDQKYSKKNDGFEIGRKIKVSSPYADESISDIFTTDTFEIVGYVTTPLYIGYERDKTSVGNGTVSGFVYAYETDFNMSYYTEMFVTLKNCDYPPFSDEYINRVNECRDDVVNAFTTSVNERYNYLYNLYDNKISSSKATVSSLEEILEFDLESLYLTKEKLSAEISECQKQIENSTSNLLILKLNKLNSNLSQLEELISARENGNESYVSALYSQLDDAKKDIAVAEKEMSSMTNPVILNYDRYASADYGSFDGDAQKIHAIGKVFPVFFIIVAGLVCLTTMSRMVEEYRTQIGTYKALGYTPFRIALKYLVYGTLASASGAFLGTIVGVKTLPIVIYNCYKILYNIPKLSTPINFRLVLACVLVSVTLTVVVVLYSCYKELSSQPSQLMRPKAPKLGKRVLIEKFPLLWNRLSFIGKVTIRNLFRYKKRFFMTVLGISGCTALILTGFGLKNSISSILNLQYGKIFDYGGMSLIDTSKVDSENVFNSLNELDDIDSAELSCQVNCKIQNGKDNHSVTIVVSENPEKLSEYVNLISPENDEKITLDDSGVVVTQKLAQLLELNKGDDITVNLAEKGNVTFKISDITENYVIHYIYISSELYEQTVEKPVYNTIFFNYKDDADTEKLSQDIISIDGILGLTLLKDNGKILEKSLNSLSGIVWLLIGCAGGLAIVVLYNLANINITERTREIATLKVLGFYDNETSSYILRENFLSATIGILLGFVLGILLHGFVVSTAEVDVVMFDRSIKPFAFVMSALLTFVFTCLVNLILHFKLKKIDMVLSLKSVE